MSKPSSYYTDKNGIHPIFATNISSADSIVTQKSIHATGKIRSGDSIFAEGHLKSGDSIISMRGIFAGDSIRAMKSITAIGRIRSGDSIISQKGIYSYGPIKIPDDSGSLTLGRTDDVSEGAQINWTGAGAHGNWIQDLYTTSMRFFRVNTGTFQIFQSGGTGVCNLTVDGFITAGDSIKATNSIRAGDSIFALRTIKAGDSIISQKSIHATGRIRSGDSIFAEGHLKSGDSIISMRGIFAGDSIRATKTIHAVGRIRSGDSIYAEGHLKSGDSIISMRGIFAGDSIRAAKSIHATGRIRGDSIVAAKTLSATTVNFNAAPTSYYSPTAGQTSYGTLHPLTNPQTVVIGAAYVNGTTYPINCSAFTPTNTRAVNISVYANSVGNGSIVFSDSTPVGILGEGHYYNYEAVYHSDHVIVPLSDTRYFYAKMGGSNATVYINVFGYYI